jgi:hypothetical protein
MIQAITRRPRYVLALASLTALAAGCSSGSSRSSTSPTAQTSPVPSSANLALTVTAGVEALDPAAQDTVSGGVDLARFGIAGAAGVFELTTPAGEPFSFHVLTREQGNAGAVKLSLAHVDDGGAVPTGGVVSLTGVGVIPEAPGAANTGDWLEVDGDGFARITLSGRIVRAQVFALRVETRRGVETVLIRVGLGARSQINLDLNTDQPATFVKERATLYSSDSWQFGLPTVATSGDRTSVVCYEGDQGDPYSSNRYEMRLQYDGTTGAVTGGGSNETSPDSGNWRDHEIAALFNVLALVHSGAQDVTLQLSFDRGATFAQTQTLGSGLAAYRQRLVQIAMAADYTLAATFWRTAADLSQELVLVEGRPSAFDAGGSPTAYAFDAPVTIHRQPTDVTPLIMGASYSAGGDLVVGYGFTKADAIQVGPGFRSTTTYRCAVRRFGQLTWTDTEVDEEIIESFDPSVALVGQGAALQVFYAYEASDGVRLKVSNDAGQTWGPALQIGDATAHQPTVRLRQQNGQLRVDVLYLRMRDLGTDLVVRHWDDYTPSNPGVDHALATGSSRDLATGDGIQVTRVNWLGYDATVDGDDLVIVYDEHTYTTGMICGGPLGAPTAMGAAAAPQAGGFTAATPPPLAPGMGQALPAPDPKHQHQLKLIRLD